LLGPAPAAAAWRRLLPSWPTIIFLAALLRVGAPQALLNDPDTYLHIAAGRWMLAHRALPFHDPFSHSLASASWVPHEWLAEIALAGAFGLAGWSGVLLITALGFAAAMALLTRFLLRRGDPFVPLVLAISSLGLVVPHLLARPHILALPLMVVWCGELIAARDDNRMPTFWLLPIMAVWANLHAGFMFGLALAAFLGVEALLWPATAGSGRSNAKHWGLFVCAAILFGLATPNGVAGLVQPFRLVTMPSLQTAVIEWRAPRLPDAPMLEFWVLGALSAGLAFGLRLPLPRLLLVAGLLYLALGHARHADLLAVVAPLAVTASLVPQVAARLRAVPTSTLTQIFKRMAMPCAPRASASALAVALGALACLPIALCPTERAKDPATPAAALAAAGAMGVSGPVFNEFGFGGYLIFKGVPTFIDGRMELYGNEFLDRYLAAQRGAQPALSELLDRYHIAWTFLSPDAGAVMQLDQLPGWRRAYADDQAVIHVRDGGPRVDRCVSERGNRGLD
jgi:hypothetical protein